MAYLDLEWTARTNPAFRAALNSDINCIAELEKDKLNAANNRVEIAKRLSSFVKKCQYNFGFLTPYFFPRYPKDQPLSLSDRPYSFSMFNFQIGGSTTFRASRQIGKEQPYSAPVLTPSGWRRMGDLSVGDLVIGRDGCSYPIEEIFEQGVRDVFRLTFTDKSTAECGWLHSWTVNGGGGARWKVRTLEDIVNRNGWEPHSDNAVRIPIVQPVHFPARTHQIPPYVLGLLLGDGSLGTTGYEVRLSTEDPEIIRFIENDMPAVRIAKRSDNDYGLCNPEKFKHNYFLKDELKRLGLWDVGSANKFVPEEYLIDSVENRLALLRGLMDTDGSIYGKCQMEFYSISAPLAAAVQWLVQSLGGTAYTKDKAACCKLRDGTQKDCGNSFRVKIKFKDINPFRMTRKASRFYPIRYERTRVLKKVQKVRQEQSRCIQVGSPDHTYVTNDFVVTHNSTSLGARQLMFSNVVSGFRSIYITPHTDQLKTYADRLREMERAFRFYKPSKNFRQNLYFKEYPNGAMIKLMYALTSAAALRGNSADELLFDEYQNFDISLEDEVLEIQKASTMPVRIFAGTSLTTDTALEAKYQASSQGVWMIKCGCGEWLNTGDREVALQLVQPEGVVCPKCSRVQDVRLGHYVHGDQDKLLRQEIGFHIPQIIIPYFTEDIVRWSEIYRKKVSGGNINKFLEEVLGIPTEEGEREITQQNLKDICVLNHAECRVKAKRGDYLLVVSGCDWGGSDYIPEAKTKVSFTVHAMLGVNHDFTIDIIHFQHYAGMDYRSVADDIVKNHYELTGEALASDFGVGQLYNMLLRERIKNIHKHLVFGYVGPSSAALSEPAGDHMFNQYSLNRTEAITSLYDAIKQKRIRCFQWEHAERYLLEFLNLFRAPNETSSGATSFTYRRHGSKADDSLHAVNFAYVLARLMLDEPLIADKMLRDRILKNLRGNNSTWRGGGARGKLKAVSG